MGAISFDHGHQYGWTGAAMQLPMVELVAVAEPDPIQRKAVAERLTGNDAAMRRLADKLQGPVRLYDHYRDLLARDDIEAVTISSANYLHREHAEAAAAAGKHVFLEKPIATNLDDATAIVRACERAGVEFCVAYPCRFSAAAIEAKEMVDRGDIGEIVSMHATNHLRKGTEGWFIDPAKSGGGTIRDHIVHGTDLMRWFSGVEVDEIYAEADTLARPDIQVDDVAMLLEKFENGIVGSCDPSWNRPMTSSKWGDVVLRVLGTEGAIDFDLTGAYLTRTLAGAAEGGEAWESAKVVTPIQQISYAESMDVFLIEDFAESILEGRRPLVTGIDGWYGVACIEAAYQSAREHRMIEVARYPGNEA